MKAIALIPLLALFASGTGVIARTSHPNAAGAHRRHVARQNEFIDRRDQLSSNHPRALEEKPKKMKKRGATGCRPRSSSAISTFTSASSTVEVSITSTSTSTSTTDQVTATTTSTSTQDSSTSASSTDAVPTTSSTDIAAYVQAADPTSASSTSTSWSAAAAATSSSSSTSSSSYTPNNVKAGIAGGDGFDAASAYIGSWYDWNAVPQYHSGTPVAINMLWGAGTVDSTDASRLTAFQAITDTPQYIIGFEEPDCSTEGSSNIGISTAAALWDSTIAPWKAKGSILVSPSMCHQAAEEYTLWLAGFSSQISTSWDITNLHINKNSMDGVKADLDYYWNTYGKPMWVTEFACVDDSTGFVPCTDQDEINTYINDIVALFESDSRVHAYHYSNGEGLGDVWPMTSNGALTTSGQTYINAIQAYA